MKLKVIINILVLSIISGIIFHFTKEGSNLITSYGSIRVNNGNTTISMTSDEPGLSIKKQLSGINLGFFSSGSTSTVSPSSWTNHKGFFSYVDETGRIWSYNGKDQSFIYEILPDGSGRSWDLKTWRHKIPKEVSSRINQ